MHLMHSSCVHGHIMPLKCGGQVAPSAAATGPDVASASWHPSGGTMAVQAERIVQVLTTLAQGGA